jgi:hypothetical protein
MGPLLLFAALQVVFLKYLVFKFLTKVSGIEDNVSADEKIEDFQGLCLEFPIAFFFRLKSFGAKDLNSCGPSDSKCNMLGN